MIVYKKVYTYQNHQKTHQILSFIFEILQENATYHIDALSMLYLRFIYALSIHHLYSNPGDLFQLTRPKITIQINK